MRNAKNERTFGKKTALPAAQMHLTGVQKVQDIGEQSAEKGGKVQRK